MANPVVQQITDELKTLQKELDHFKNTTSYLNGAKQHVSGAIKSLNDSEANFEKRIMELKGTYEALINLKNSIDKTLKKIGTINFPEKLDNIEKTVKETIESINSIKKDTIDELRKASETVIKADFEGKFKKLQESVEKSVRANEALKETIIKEDIGGKVKRGNEEAIEKIQEALLELDISVGDALNKTKKFIQDLNLPIRMDKLDANIAGISASIQNIQSRLETLERNLGDKVKEGFEKQTQIISSLQIQLQQNNNSMKKKLQLNTYITWAILILGMIGISLLVWQFTIRS